LSLGSQSVLNTDRIERDLSAGGGKSGQTDQSVMVMGRDCELGSRQSAGPAAAAADLINRLAESGLVTI
jgi:hypothetical protein